MTPLVKKLASILALGAGVLLIYFEWRRAGGITADNAFWLLIGSLIIILAALNVFTSPPNPPPGGQFPDDKLPLN
jgi:hypothetical protein